MTTDNRVTIKIDLEEDVLYQLMLHAHELDITLNQMVDRILREFIDEHEKSKV